MKLIRGFLNIPDAMHGCILTIGTFDGVHLGHQALLQAVKTAAAAECSPSLVMTFEPQPNEFFADNLLPVARLTRFAEKFELFSQFDMDGLLRIKFDQAIAQLSAVAFVDQIIAQLAPKVVILGHDFRFGAKRIGDVNLMRTLGERHFDTRIIEPVLHAAKRISSTWVRAALSSGDHATAEQLLGRKYSMRGRIVHGDRLGRELGFPTANIFLHRQQSPLNGIYSVIMHGIDQLPYRGVAYVGPRPTVNGSKTILEVHLLDFNQDIYGRYVHVEFCAKLREDARFNNLEALKTAIANDINAARQFFQANDLNLKR